MTPWRAMPVGAAVLPSQARERLCRLGAAGHFPGKRPVMGEITRGKAAGTTYRERVLGFQRE